MSGVQFAKKSLVDKLGLGAQLSGEQLSGVQFAKNLIMMDDDDDDDDDEDDYDVDDDKPMKRFPSSPLAVVQTLFTVAGNAVLGGAIVSV